MTLTFRNRQLPERWFLREQGWRTYGTSAQNGKRNDFLGTRNSLLFHFLFFARPASLYCDIYIYIYITHTHTYIYIYTHTHTYIYTHKHIWLLTGYMNYRSYQITLRVKHYYKIDSRSTCWLDIYHWGVGLAVNGRIHDIGQNVLQSSFLTWSSSSPSYIQIVFLIAFLDETFFF